MIFQSGFLFEDTIAELESPVSAKALETLFSIGRINVPESDIEKFADQYLLELAKQIHVIGDAVDWQEYDLIPVPRLYLNETNGELFIQLRFAYQDVELDYDPSMPLESIQQIGGSLRLVRISRKPQKEQEYYDLLMTSGFGLKRAPIPGISGYFRLKARVHPVNFILNILPRLAQEGYEVFGEEKLKTARVNRHTPTISFKISSGIDWFDVRTIILFGDQEVPIKELRRMVRKQERYIKLADGSIGEIPEDWLERFRHIFAIGEIQGQVLRLSKNHLNIIEAALEGSDPIQADDEFSHRRSEIKKLMSRNFHEIPPRSIPDGFIGELRPYQKAGFDWLHFLRDHQLGGCLADDMGLGKTIQTLAFLRSIYSNKVIIHEQLTASLLVVPRSLLVNWQREAARFTPDLKIFEFFDSNRGKSPEVFQGNDLVVTTYGIMLRDIHMLHSYPFHYIILDEFQAIKNPLSQTARAAHLLRSQHRLVLTGTPIENSTSELWSQFHFLNPGLLGNMRYFKNEFGLPIEKRNDEYAAEKLRKMVFPFILRRTKAQVAPELPPKTERIIYCDMEPSQRKMYNRVRDSYRSVLLGLIENQTIEHSKLRIIEGLLRLRQISNHPKLVDEKYHGSSGKFDFLIEMLMTLKYEGHKALVFSQFVQMLNLIRTSIDAQGIPYAYLDGQTQSRQEQVDTFQDHPEIPLFLISLKAGGLGLNLTAADYVIQVDPWWNPAVEEQASNRTHRIGQDKPVFIFRLITKDSVEEKVLLLQERKKNLAEQIISSKSGFFKNLSAEELEDLFS